MVTFLMLFVPRFELLMSFESSFELLMRFESSLKLLLLLDLILEILLLFFPSLKLLLLVSSVQLLSDSAQQQLLQRLKLWQQPQSRPCGEEEL